MTVLLCNQQNEQTLCQEKLHFHRKSKVTELYCSLLGHIGRKCMLTSLNEDPQLETAGLLEHLLNSDLLYICDVSVLLLKVQFGERQIKGAIFGLMYKLDKASKPFYNIN